jgi:hypothetical protein
MGFSRLDREEPAGSKELLSIGLIDWKFLAILHHYAAWPLMAEGTENKASKQTGDGETHVCRPGVPDIPTIYLVRPDFSSARAAKTAACNRCGIRARRSPCRQKYFASRSLTHEHVKPKSTPLAL